MTFGRKNKSDFKDFTPRGPYLDMAIAPLWDDSDLPPVDKIS